MALMCRVSPHEASRHRVRRHDARSQVRPAHGQDLPDFRVGTTGNQRGFMLASGKMGPSGGRRANGRRRRPAGLTKAGTARGSPPHAPAGSCPDSAEPLRSCEVECSSRTPQGHGQGPSFGPCGDRRSSGRRAAAPAPREPHAESQAGVARRLAGPTPPIRQPGGGTARKLAVASVTFL